ncbi:hypothetical protein F183_A19730 [Bryobacterales bacterium F-183]|nr:hypothetical protein F183_A19730 [Bryobacterales bacterium F-183]
MMPMTGTIARAKATPVDRLVAVIIDSIIMVPVYLVVGLVVGLTGAILSSPMVAGFITNAVVAVIGAAWFLMRDAMGLSIGKKIMGLEVVSKHGGPASQEQLKKRNFTLAGGQACVAVPFIGGLVAFAVNIYEAYMLFSKGERYGDQMAETMVVKKAA